MIDALEAHMRSEHLPLKIRTRLNQARLLLSSAAFERRVDQLAVRMTLNWQEEFPLLVTLTPQANVLSGMLMRRLGFALEATSCFSSSPSAQDFAALAHLNIVGRPVILLWHAQAASAWAQSVQEWCQAREVSSVSHIALVGSRGLDTLLQDQVILEEELGQGELGQGEIGEGEIGEGEETGLGDAVVIGCGLDLDGYAANLPHLYAC